MSWTPSPNANRLRGIVADYLRHKYEKDGQSLALMASMVRYSGNMTPEEILQRILNQVWNDALHSALLLRLMDGYEWLDDERWEKQQERWR